MLMVPLDPCVPSAPLLQTFAIFLWVAAFGLVRHSSRQMDPDLFNDIIADLSERGFDLSRLLITDQPLENNEDE